MTPLRHILLGMALAAPFASQAANFDGSATLVCATLEAVQCSKTTNDRHGCIGGVAQALDVPQFIKIDFSKKLITATEESKIENTSAIGSVSQGNGHLILQGVDDGHGWSMVIEENTGYMTASAVGDEEGVMVFGACTKI